MLVTVDTAKLESRLIAWSKDKDEAWEEVYNLPEGSEREEKKKTAMNISAKILEAKHTLPFLGLCWNPETMKIEGYNHINYSEVTE